MRRRGNQRQRRRDRLVPKISEEALDSFARNAMRRQLLVNLFVDLSLRQIGSTPCVSVAQTRAQLQRLIGAEIDEEPVVVSDHKVDSPSGWKRDRQFFQRQRARRVARRNWKELQI